MTTIKMQEVHERLERAQERAGKAARRWLKQELRSWLEADQKLAWLKAEFWRDDEGDLRVDVTSDKRPGKGPAPQTGETEAEDALQFWIWYLGLTHKEGERVRVTRDGKVYRHTPKGG